MPMETPKEMKDQDGPVKEESAVSRRKRKNIARDMIIAGVALLVIAGGFAYLSWRDSGKKSESVVKDKVTEFVKTAMVSPGTDVKLTDFSRQGSLYRATFSVGGQSIVSYVTLDGSTFFPQGINMDERAKEAENAPKPKTEADTKTEKPTVDLFVMSYCPFGLQMQKGILPVIEKLGSSIDFNMRWVSYTMHGKKEFNENIRQYCIDKEESAKYLPYLSCFASSASGDSVGCGKTAKINEAKNAACIAAADKEFKLTENYDSANEGSSPFGIDKALNEQYGVSGSPTLVVNGTTLSVSRDPASLLSAICSGFSKAPEACSAKLASETPAPGFGTGTSSGGGSAASCQ